MSDCSCAFAASPSWPAFMAAASFSAICALRCAITARSMVLGSSGSLLQACSAFCKARSASCTSVGSSCIARPLLARENSSRASTSDLGGMRSPPQAQRALTLSAATGPTTAIRLHIMTLSSQSKTLVTLCLRQVLLRLLRLGLGLLRLGHAQGELGLDACDGREARRAPVVLVHQLLRLLEVFLGELKVELRVRYRRRPALLRLADVVLRGGPLIVGRWNARPAGHHEDGKDRAHHDSLDHAPHPRLVFRRAVPGRRGRSTSSTLEIKGERPRTASVSEVLQSTLRIAKKACWGISTVPTCFIRFLPSFCFSRSLRF